MRLLRGGQSKHLEGITLQSIILIVLMFAMLYFFMIRPENKRKKEADNLRSSLTVGDNVLTIGRHHRHHLRREGRHRCHRDRR